VGGAGYFPRRGEGPENLFTNMISKNLNLFLLTALMFSGKKAKF
jgi:hypothetical protein